MPFRNPHASGRPRAPISAASDLVSAVAAALASIGEAVAMSPTTYATESATMGADGHPVCPNGMTLFNLTVQPHPGAGAGAGSGPEHGLRRPAGAAAGRP